MKILAINGSPRKGNTDFLIESIAKDAEVIYLRDTKINFCSGSDHCCPKTGRCDKKDDMHSIYEKIEAADLIILASPCYFFNVSGMMKNFMDRCNPYFFNKKLKDKKFFLIAVGGHEPSLPEEIRCMKNFVKGVHGKVAGEFIAVADKAGEVKNPKVIKQIEKIKIK
ncbi:MAG: flavodoxin family protein [Nanoarchaeota archaeon]|nr:flavodoxin family protein [Nanoarchaeota archaeon]